MLQVSNDELLHEDRGRDLTILARPKYSQAFLAQLEQTEFGTSGLRYRRLGLPAQLERLPNPVFFELRQRDDLLGTYALACSQVACSDTVAQGIYRGLLTLHPTARGGGQARYFVEQVLGWLQERARAVAMPTVTWGCIERRNERSLGLLQSAGARRLGTLESLMAYRQWPRERVSVELVDDAGAIASAFADTHKDCGLRRIGSAATPFYALASQARIDAGAHVSMTAINMTRSGGFWESVFDRLMRSVPAARRRYDPHNFRYLRLSDVVARPGKQHLWPDFLTTLLARHDAHMAMFMLDPRCQAYLLLDEAGLLGRFAASTRQHIEVLAHAWHAPPGLLDELAALPLAIGPLDI